MGRKKKNKGWMIIVITIFLVGISLAIIRYLDVDLGVNIPIKLNWEEPIESSPSNICKMIEKEDICVRCSKEGTKFRCIYEFLEPDEWVIKEGGVEYYCSPLSVFNDERDKMFYCNNEDCLNDAYIETQQCEGSFGKAYRTEKLFVKGEDLKKIKDGIELESGEYQLIISGGTERFHKIKFYVDLCDDSKGVYCVQIRMEGRKGLYPKNCEILEEIGFDKSKSIDLIPGVREVDIKVNTPNKLKICDIYAQGIYIW